MIGRSVSVSACGLGYEFSTAPDRLRHLDRSLATIVKRWGKLNPPPVHGRPPILIGGGGEKVTLRITAQYADIWNGFGLPDVARHKCHVLDEHCRRLGRDPGEIERSIGGFNAERITLLDDYLAAGVTHFIMGVGGPDWDLGQLSKLIATATSTTGAKRCWAAAAAPPPRGHAAPTRVPGR